MNILLKPVITEKATADSELKNRFTFLVDTMLIRFKLKKLLKKLMEFLLTKLEP